MTRKADKDLLRAVLEPRKPGAMKKIADAIGAGADPDAICPACDSPSGRMRAGSTLLTHSVHEWASKAVSKLLECGADPNRTDDNGWTPWMASTLADESKRSRIQATLREYGADTSGEHIGPLARAIYDGDVDKAHSLIQSDRDLEVLSTFRVDLFGHQIGQNRPQMLQFLLGHNMNPSSTHLLNSIRVKDPAALEVLLCHGMPPENPADNETPLMTAASMGDLSLVQQLVKAGGDVNRYADGNLEWTASFYARQAGHTAVAEWLDAQMSAEAKETQALQKATRDPKFELLYAHATASESHSTDDLVQIFTRWDETYGVSIDDAKADRVALRFASLPGNLDCFVQEILDLCPDACDYESALVKELQDGRKLHLWWD